jgi:hypothetical protein
MSKKKILEVTEREINSTENSSPNLIYKEKLFLSQEPEIYNLTHGSYEGVTKRNMNKFKVKYIEDILERKEYMNEYINNIKLYKLFLDYDENLLNSSDCKKIIMDYIKTKGLVIIENMVKICYKSDGSKKYHFVIPSYCATVEEQKKFWEGIQLKYDPSVYRKHGWFRLPNQMKPEANGKPSEESYYIPLEDAKLDDFILGKLDFYTTEIPKQDVKTCKASFHEKEQSSFDVKKVKTKLCEAISAKEEITISKDEHYSKRIEKYRTILSGLNDIRTDEYDDWIKVGMILKNELGDSGYDLWYDFSRRSKKFKGNTETIKKWDTFNETKEVKLGEGTLLMMKILQNIPIMPMSDITVIQPVDALILTTQIALVSQM